MSVAPPAPCELLSWDTNFFACRIARVCGDVLDEALAAEVDDWCRENRIRGLYYLCPADDPGSIRTARQSGFELTDIRMTLEQILEDSNKPASQPMNNRIRLVQPDDLPALQTLARSTNRGTRFFNDPHFSPQKAEELYATWIRLDAQGRAGKVWVAASPDNRPMGYISGYLDPEKRAGKIGLVGVSSEWRGQGIGKDLVVTALDWFRAQNAGQVSVITQGTNLAAQRLYQRCGFISGDLQLWYHKWYSVPDQPSNRDS